MKVDDTIKSNHTNENIEYVSSVRDLPKAFVDVSHHTHDQVIGNTEDGVKTKSRIEQISHCAFVPKNVDEICEEKLQQFERNKV